MMTYLRGSLERIVICEPAAKPCYNTPILRPSVFVWMLTKFEVGLKMLIGPNIFFTVPYRYQQRLLTPFNTLLIILYWST